MKSVKDFVMNDMWNHNLMSGDEIRGCVTGAVHATPEAKNKYCQGIFVTFPHMMLNNFCTWMWPDGNTPKPYGDFMTPSVEALQKKVFPELDRYFSGNLSETEKGALMAGLLTKVIPQHVLTGFYDYMFFGQEDYKDISDFWTQAAPLLGMTAKVIEAGYAGMNVNEKAEMYTYLGARYPFLLLKRLYDWQFGKEKMEGGPGGPPPGGGPGGPPPGGPGGPPHP